jgi:type I restriction enzyme, R subunit
MLESNSRIVINRLLKESGWLLYGDNEKPSVNTEVKVSSGFADYVLYDSKDFPIAVIEAKKELIDPLFAKEQARSYALDLKCRFTILSNGIKHYLWDLNGGNPNPIDTFPSQSHLESARDNFKPNRLENEIITEGYIAQTQLPNFDQKPEYINPSLRSKFINDNQLRILRDYQLNALKAVQEGVRLGKDRFLLEMATGTGKTLTSSAIIKMFIRLYNVKRVLFLVDRIELESQAQKEFDQVLKNDFRTVIWKENQSDWKKAEIVVSTVQSFVSKNKYRKLFYPDDFDLVISDEAHRSLGKRSRKVFEYFIGFKLGLTATPKDYLKSIDLEKIAEHDPRQLERRMLLDTYSTFGCESGEPTFRYSLENGVKDGYLINPIVFDARTDITTQLLSDKGYVYQDVDEDGKDVEEIFKQKDFEKRFFSKLTNTIFVETFIKKALRDPYTSEIGKTLIFCVSQNHASKITQILNQYADKLFPNKYNSDFAVQVTSLVQDAQRMTVDFRNNTLNGRSKANNGYLTSKTRVCVTVGMMTTGYDCSDLLNICMMRPIYSPSEFIQMKGRGTRKFDFSRSWIDKSIVPYSEESVKQNYYLFDFFGNYEYFENEFDYNEKLSLPSKPSVSLSGEKDTLDIDAFLTEDPDELKELKQIIVSEEGMKIDRRLYKAFKDKVYQDDIIVQLVKEQRFDSAKERLEEHIFNKPSEYYNVEKLTKTLGLDRKPSATELLLLALDHIDHIPTFEESVNEQFDRLDSLIGLTEEQYNSVKEVFEAYILDEEFRYNLDRKNYGFLLNHTSNHAFREMAQNKELLEQFPMLIKENIDLEKLEHVR